MLNCPQKVGHNLKGMKYKKRSFKERLAICQMLADGASMVMVEKVSGVSQMLLKEWYLKYQIHGEYGLHSHSRKSYSDAEKEALVLEFQNKDVSLLHFCIERHISHTQFRKWCKAYTGADDYSKHVSQVSSIPQEMKPPIPEEYKQLSQEELLEELAYLRAENALLKKVKALMDEKRARQLKNGRKPSSR